MLDEPKKLHRKRRIEDTLPPPAENIKIDVVNDQPEATPAEPSKKKRKRKSRRKLYEIDNSNLPSGLPPIVAFLPDWEGSAPVRSALENKAAQEISQIDDKKANRKPKKVKVPRKVNKPQKEIMQMVLETLKRYGHPMTKLAIFDTIPVPQAQCETALNSMLKDGQIFVTRKLKFGLPEQLGFIEGIIQSTNKGFAFLLPTDETDDIFIPQNSLNGALNGDKVLVRTLESHGSSREGEVLSILSRVNTRIVGTLAKYGQDFYIEPDNRKLHTSFLVKSNKKANACEGQKVVCKLNYESNIPYATVEEVIGYPDDAGTDVLSIIKARDIPEVFPKPVIMAARNVPDEVLEDEITRREDLRKLQLFTIDGAYSKDFDDAVSCEKMNNGNYLLGVHIADVSHYVKESGAIDKEAYKRGTSVYFIDRVIPMLPESLSNGICSLNPGVDRLALSCFIELDPNGKVLSHRISESVINSKMRFVYGDVTEALAGDASLCRKFEEYMPTLSIMEELAAALREQRNKRGSIDFDIPEAAIEVDTSGQPVNISVRERGTADKLIEEFMLCCNETVAAHMAYLDCPTIFRIHEIPDSEKVEELNSFLGGFGYGIKGLRGGLRSKGLQTIMNKVSGKPEESVISRVILRSLKKARYSPENKGHFGLAAEYYCHFTSPIRRYPDLMVHRIIKELINGQINPKRQEILRASLQQISEMCSERERNAMEAEREVDDLKKCEYMSRFIGDTFSGIISGVTRFGMFVELENTCEGMVRLTDMLDDHYIYEEKEYRLIGDHTRKVYRLGEIVKVRVKQVDIGIRKVDFELVQDEFSRHPRRRSNRRISHSKL